MIKRLLRPAFHRRVNAFQEAARHGDLETMRMVYRDDNRVLNALTGHRNKRSALFLAAERGQSHVVEWLLKRGNIQAYHEDDRKKKASKELLCSPLLESAAAGYLYIVEMLLKHDPSMINQSFYKDLTPLFVATRAGHVDVIAFLIKQPEVRINLVAEEDDVCIGSTVTILRCAYDCCMSSKRYGMIQNLLQHDEINPNIRTQDDEGETLLTSIIRRSKAHATALDRDLVQLLLAHPKIDVNDTNPMYYAIQHFSPFFTNALLLHDGIDPDALLMQSSQLTTAGSNDHQHPLDVASPVCAALFCKRIGWKLTDADKTHISSVSTISTSCSILSTTAFPNQGWTSADRPLWSSGCSSAPLFAVGGCEDWDLCPVSPVPPQCLSLLGCTIQEMEALHRGYYNFSTPYSKN